MAKYVSSANFADEARRRFSFLRELDFRGPEEGSYQLSYSTGALGVEVLYDDRDGRVITIVRSFLPGRNPTAGLPCLYVEARLGPSQDIREIARSAKSLGAVLESQAEALRRVLPVIAGPTGANLLLRCHGR